MKKLLLLIAVLSMQTLCTAQDCKVLSMFQIGGPANRPVGICQNTFSDSQSFHVMVYGYGSHGGNLYPGCPSTFYYMRWPHGGYQSQSPAAFGCAPSGNHNALDLFVWPLPGGDTVSAGQHNTTSFSIQRRSGDTVRWAYLYGGNGGDLLERVVAARDGGYFLIGYTLNSGGDVGQKLGPEYIPDAFLVRVDSNGQKMWARVLGGTGPDEGYEVLEQADGGCLVFGTTYSDDMEGTGNHGDADIFAARLDSAGNTLWSRCYGGSAYDGRGMLNGSQMYAMRAPDGGYYVLGMTQSVDGDVGQALNGEYDLWLLRLDSAGNILWQKTYGGLGRHHPTGLCRGADGSIWMTANVDGNSQPSGHMHQVYSAYDAFVVHADSMGNFINSLAVGNGSTEVIRMLHPLPDGTVLVGGDVSFYGVAANSPASPLFPTVPVSPGGRDGFILHLGPETDLGMETERPNPVGLRIYPNPGRERIGISVARPGNYRYSVLGMDGKVLLEGSFRDATEVGTGALAPGQYLMKVSDRAGDASVSEKFVIY